MDPKTYLQWSVHNFSSWSPPKCRITLAECGGKIWIEDWWAHSHNSRSWFFFLSISQNHDPYYWHKFKTETPDNSPVQWLPIFPLWSLFHKAGNIFSHTCLLRYSPWISAPKACHRHKNVAVYCQAPKPEDLSWFVNITQKFNHPSHTWQLGKSTSSRPHSRCKIPQSGLLMSWQIMEKRNDFSRGQPVQRHVRKWASLSGILCWHLLDHSVPAFIKGLCTKKGTI